MKYAYLSIIILCLAGCSGINVQQWHFPYTPQVRQGTYITQNQISQLHPGLTREQVSLILGAPLNKFIFNQQQWYLFYQDYVNGKLTRSYTLTLDFNSHDVLINIIHNGEFFSD